MSSKLQNKDATPNEIKFVQDQLLGGRPPLFIKWVTKKKRDKIQDRLIVVGDYRVFSIKKTVTGKKKIQRVGHLFDLVEIFSGDVDKCVLKFREFEIDITASTAGIELIGIIRKAFQRISYAFADYALPKIILMPQERILQDLPSIDPGPAAGLLATYEAFCDYYKVPPSQEFVKYVNDLVQQGVRDLVMDQCPGIDRKEDPLNFIPIRAALRHNTYFTGFTLRNIPRRELSLCMADTLIHNVTLEKIVLSGVDMQSDAAIAIGNSLKRNNHNRVHDIDVSFNKSIGDKGALGLADGLQSLTHSMSRLNIAGCQFSPKATAQIFQAFGFGKDVSWGLVELDLSHNNFSSAGSMQVANWFNQQGGASLQRFYAVNSKLDVGLIMRAIKNSGKLAQLQEIDLSNNKVDAGAGTAIAQAIETLPSLSNLCLANCSMQAPQAIAIVSAIATNVQIRSASINFSFNELGPSGAASLSQIIANATNISSLILRACEFKKEGLQKIADSLATNAGLRILDISLNFHSGSEAKMRKLMETFAFALSRHTSLEFFSLSGDNNKFAIGKEIEPLIKCLGNDPKLVEIDVSGNKMGDQLAGLLSDSLRNNKHLKALYWDKNNISMGGWQSLVNIMNNNTTLCHVPNPKADVDKAVKESKNKEQFQERVKVVMDSLSNSLKRNSGGLNFVSAYEKVKGKTYKMASMVTSDSADGTNAAPMTGSLEQQQQQFYNDNPYPNYSANTMRSPYDRKASDSYQPPPPPPPIDNHTGYDNSFESAPPPPPPPPDPYSNYKYQADQTEYDDSNYDNGNDNYNYDNSNYDNGNTGYDNGGNNRKSTKPNDTVYAAIHYDDAEPSQESGGAPPPPPPPPF